MANIEYKTMKHFLKHLYWFLLVRMELTFFIVATLGLRFWICAENRVDSSGIFLVIAELCLHRVKAFSASHPTSK